MSRAQEQGLRQCKPSSIELVYILGNFTQQGRLDHTLIVPVYLTDGTTLVSPFVACCCVLLLLESIVMCVSVMRKWKVSAQLLLVAAVQRGMYMSADYTQDALRTTFKITWKA